MDEEDITVEIVPPNGARPIRVQFHSSEEPGSDYLTAALSEYCGLHFRVTKLSTCSIWHTRFIVHKKMDLRVSGAIPCTFLWAMWRNSICYTIDSLPEKQIPINHYNLYHLPDIRWTIHFKQPGEYETFNIIFTGFDFDYWKNNHLTPDLQIFLERMNRDERAFLSPAHRLITDPLEKVIGDTIRGPVAPTNTLAFYEDKVLDLIFYVVRDIAKTNYVPQTALRPAEIEKLYQLRDTIARHPERSHTMKDLARTAGMNKSKLGTNFKELFKTTVFEFIREQRMQMAHKLLKETTLSVKEVAAATGYKNPSNFTEAYRKYFGYAPTNSLRR